MKLVINGAEYGLTKRPLARIPSKRKTVVSLVLDGTPTEVPYTVNSGWCDKPEFSLTRLWFVRETPADGEKPASKDAYFAILDYGVAAETVKDAEATIVDGTAARKDPDRVPREGMVEARRATLAATLEAKKAETPAAPEGEAPTDAPDAPAADAPKAGKKSKKHEATPAA